MFSFLRIPVCCIFLGLILEGCTPQPTSDRSSEEINVGANLTAGSSEEVNVDADLTAGSAEASSNTSAPSTVNTLASNADELRNEMPDPMGYTKPGGCPCTVGGFFNSVVTSKDGSDTLILDSTSDAEAALTKGKLILHLSDNSGDGTFSEGDDVLASCSEAQHSGKNLEFWGCSLSG